MKISAAIVTYENKPQLVLDAVHSLLNTPIESELWIVDNSSTDALGDYFIQLPVKYYYNHGQNQGFGKAHNLALTKAIKADYHLVLNPDVYFDSKTILALIDYLEQERDIGLIEPKICYPNDEIQYLCKRYPSVFLLFARRFIPKQLSFLYRKYMSWYEMRDMGYDRVFDVPYLSGCFMLFRRSFLDEIGGFDENIFMYLEDADITIRMAKNYRTVFYPDVKVYHHWAKGSYNSLRLTLINIQSAIYFFNKHGWKLF
jgi:GT2 family glycosyltransferase